MLVEYEAIKKSEQYPEMSQLSYPAFEISSNHYQPLKNNNKRAEHLNCDCNSLE